MKAAVVTFPGSNCDDDIRYTLTQNGMAVSAIWHKDRPSLSEYNLVVLPGGFSYGDYLRSGAIAALSPVMGAVKEYAGAGGLVLGICNGFQILCEAGLLPGALARNEKLHFRCLDVELKVESEADTPWTYGLPVGTRLQFPIAHGEGRYTVDEAEYSRIRDRGQVLLTYTDNPNGSVHGIAGVCNEGKNVFGLMPHPERATDLRSKDGQKMWNGLIRWIREKSA